MKFLSQEQKKYYDENGFIKLENLFSDTELNQVIESYESLFKVRPIRIIWWKVLILNKQTHAFNSAEFPKSTQ